MPRTGGGLRRPERNPRSSSRRLRHTARPARSPGREAPSFRRLPSARPCRRLSSTSSSRRSISRGRLASLRVRQRGTHCRRAARGPRSNRTRTRSSGGRPARWRRRRRPSFRRRPAGSVCPTRSPTSSSCRPSSRGRSAGRCSPRRNHCRRAPRPGHPDRGDDVAAYLPPGTFAGLAVPFVP